MENLVMDGLFGNTFKGKKVFLTGHTGFKGSWMALWLKEMGAEVIGFSHPEPPSDPLHLDQLHLDIQSIAGDIRDPKAIAKAMKDTQPEVVIHMAAQSLVRESYKNPIDTYSTNVMGTLHVLEAARQAGSVKAIVNITSDKAYENREWVWGYRENDPMGGYDPYNSNKGCAELLASSYRRSFFSDNSILLASARAGNVIGGGDWADDRIIPDIFRAAGKGKRVSIRNPKAIRPWQHVLEPLSGYLLLAQKMLEGDEKAADGWNFGPGIEATIPVGELFEKASQHWDAVKMELDVDPNAPHEANLLQLDWSKARIELNWTPIWTIDQAVASTAQWYRDFFTGNGDNIRKRSLTDLHNYMVQAKKQSAPWTK